MKKTLIAGMILAASFAYGQTRSYTYQTNAFGEVFRVYESETGAASVTGIPAAPRLQLDVTKTASQIGQFGVDPGKAAYVGVSKDGAFIPIPTVTVYTNTAAALLDTTQVVPNSIGSFIVTAPLGMVIEGVTGNVAIATTATTNGWMVINARE